MVNEYSDIEKIALDLRNNWELGMDPIDNITLTLEDKNIKILILDTVDRFDACTFWVNKDIPVIVIKSNISKERQRFRSLPLLWTQFTLRGRGATWNPSQTTPGSSLES